MKKYLINVAVAILINIAIIPAILLQAYYIGGESCYYSEVIDPKNLENLVTFMTLSGAWYGFYLTLFINTIVNVDKNDITLKKSIFFSIKLLVVAILIILVLAVPEFINIFSETMIALIQTNSCFIFIILMMTTIIKETSEIRKINKKLKEKK